MPRGFVVRTRLAIAPVFVGAIFALNLSAQPRPAPPPPQPVTVLAISGTVEVLRDGAQTWDFAATLPDKNILRPGDQLRTGPNSLATVLLSDRTIQRIGPQGHLQVLADAKPGLLLKLYRGVYYFFHRDRPGELRIQAPTVAAVIRGTEFQVEVSPDTGSTIVSLFEGEVELSDMAGEQLRLRSGEAARVEPGRRPAPSPMLEAINVIQWWLYYPAVLDPDELELDAAARVALEDSLSAYRSGDLLAALQKLPEQRQPVSDSEKIYWAALLLAIGRVDRADALLDSLAASGKSDARPAALARALRTLIDAVKVRPRSVEAVSTAQRTASESLAESYYLQSRSDLKGALAEARRAAERSANFGFAHARVAELEFSHARTHAARRAVQKSLEVSPRNAQALALHGFLLTAENRIEEATISFDRAIGIDSGLGNAWLGRGLCRIRLGQAEAGRLDIEVAAALEPQRSLLRSYLGKAFSHEGETKLALKELHLAKTLDTNDPTAWLYSALLRQQNNRINEAVRDLEHSQELNENRRVYRSGLLLDQDQAVRGANLANVYLDAGMTDVSVREATRAVNADYANYSAHLFLANSYNQLRDPRQVDLRYETAWFAEYLLANLLSPVGAGTLSQTVSQHEYSKLFERDRLGLVSSTEYLSRGDWIQSAAHYGTFGNTGYALEANYRSENGQRPNNDQEQLTLALHLKQQLTPRDAVYLQTIYYSAEGGDLSQYYDPADANPQFRFEEKQEPLLLAGYHHEWHPGMHTLLLAGRFQDTFEFFNPTHPELLLYKETNTVRYVPLPAFALGTNQYRSELEGYSAELQQIWQQGQHSLIVGGRYQLGAIDTTDQRLSNSTPYRIINEFGRTSPVPPMASSSRMTESDLHRFTVYGYHHWEVTDSLLLTAGLSYDRLTFPSNYRVPPISDDEQTEHQLSPKGGVTWRPGKRTTLRAGYTRSLGGVSFDQSFRLEPTQVAGFNQAFRSLVPESVAGNNAGAEFETFGVAGDHRLASATYFGAEAVLLRSEFQRKVGAVDLTSTFPPLRYFFTPASTRQDIDFEERSLAFTLNQLVGREWSFGGRYRLSQAELEARFFDIPEAAVTAHNLRTRVDLEARLHQLNLFAIFAHPSGVVGNVEALWSSQRNSGYSPALADDEFWQFNASVGYRFPRRRAELRIGVLNITDQDYRLNPLNLTAELPRRRTFFTSLRIAF